MSSNRAAREDLLVRTPLACSDFRYWPINEVATMEVCKVGHNGLGVLRILTLNGCRRATECRQAKMLWGQILHLYRLRLP